MTKGLSSKAFDEYWNANWFQTKGSHALVHEIHRELLTRKTIDIEILWIIYLAFTARQLREAPFDVPERPDVEWKRLLEAVKTIKHSPLHHSLPSNIEEALIRRIEKLPSDQSIVEDLVRPHLQSSNPGPFVSGLLLLDRHSATKPTKYVESFFICLLSNRFRRTAGSPNFSLVSKIILMCFGGKKLKDKTINQRCRDFTLKFPTWRIVASVIRKDVLKKKLVGLPTVQS
jgi:hypothetical protein